MSTFEVSLLQACCFSLLIYEFIFLRPKYIMFLPSADNPYFMGKFEPEQYDEIKTPKSEVRSPHTKS